MCMQACIAGADRPGGWITRRSDTRHADAVRSWPEWRRASCRLCGWSRGRACLGRHGLSVCAHRRGTCGARRARPQDVGARRDPSERARSSAAMLTSARRRHGGLRGDALRSARRRRGKENAHNQELIIDRSYQMGCRPAGPSCERPGGRPGETTVPQAAANRCNLAARGAGQSRARARLCASARVTQPGFVRRPRFCAAPGLRPRLPSCTGPRVCGMRDRGLGTRNPEPGTRDAARRPLSAPPRVRACVRGRCSACRTTPRPPPVGAHARRVPLSLLCSRRRRQAASLASSSCICSATAPCLVRATTPCAGVWARVQHSALVHPPPTRRSLSVAGTVRCSN